MGRILMLESYKYEITNQQAPIIKITNTFVLVIAIWLLLIMQIVALPSGVREYLPGREQQ